MIKLSEEALICDFAEVYHIYDYKQLPPTRVAVFACGLRDNSRIKMKLSGQTVPFDTLIMAGIADRLSILVWAQTKDGQKGKNKPPMLINSLVAKERKETDAIVFQSGEDFEKARNKILHGVKVGGEI